MSRATPQRALKATTLLATVVMAIAVSAPPATAAPKVENGNIMFNGYDLIQSADWAVWQVLPKSTDGGRVSTWVDTPGDQFGAKEARYSADGTKVAYTHDVDIIVRDAASGAVIQVLEDMGFYSQQGLDWSPDATQLVVIDWRSIRTIDLATGTQSTIFQRSRNWDYLGDGISWSPDGKWITFSTDGLLENSIRSIRPDGTGLKRVLYQAPSEGYWFDRPQWSPDSTRLAYVYRQVDLNTNVTISTELVTVDKKGENPVHVSNIAESLWSTTGSLAAGHKFVDVAWSPDGKRIAALDYVEPNVGRVRAYVADGSNRAWVTPMERIGEYSTFDWARKLP